MKKTKQFTIAFLMVFFIILVSMPLYANASDTYISVLIVDKTGSMVGKGDGNGESIWNDVQGYLLNYVDGIQLNTQVVFYEFDRDLYGPEVFFVDKESVKNDIREYIKGMDPNGQNTAIYDALNKALNYMDRNYRNNKKLMYLITDGKDNASGMSFSRIMTEFNATRGEFDHLYYIDLRDRAADNVRREAKTNPHFTLTKKFTKVLTLRPLFETIPVLFDGNDATFTQRFYVDGGILPDSFTFNSNFLIPEDLVANIDITPSRNINIEQLNKIEEGRYEMKYSTELLAGSLRDTTVIPIMLEAPDMPGYVFTFIPEIFNLQLQEKRARVIAVKGGWKD